MFLYKTLWFAIPWLLTIVFSSAHAMGTFSAERNVQFCLAKDNAWSADEHIDRMKVLGITCATVYYKLNAEDNLKHPFDWIRDKYVRNDYDVVMVLMIDEGNVSYVGSSEGTDVSAGGPPGRLERIIRGDYDPQLTVLAERITKVGKRITVRPLHEIDGGWYPWGMYAEGNTPELAADAFVHIANVFSRVGAPTSFDTNINRRDGKQLVLGDAERYMPKIMKVSESRSVSSYNRCLSNPIKYPKSRTFAEEFRPVYQRLLKFGDQPINVAEVSTTNFLGCQDKLEWFEEMLESIDTEFTKVEQITFMFGDVPVGAASNLLPIQWGFSTDAERLKFRAVLDKYRKKWKAPAKSSVSYPWSFRLSVVDEFDGPFNDSINSLTGKPFGEVGTVLRTRYKSAAHFEAGEDESHGPYVTLSSVISDNENQWWNNHADIGVGYEYCWKMRSIGDWGSLCGYVQGQKSEYFDEHPEDLEDTVYRGGINFIVGGDYAK
jgi:hypothetical protein